MAALPVEPQALHAESSADSTSPRNHLTVWLVAVGSLAKRAESRPLLPLAIGFVGGVVAAGSLSGGVVPFGGVALVLIAVGLLWTRRISGLTLPALVLIGMSLGLFRHEMFSAQAVPLPAANRLYDVQGFVASQPADGPYSSNFFIDVTSVDGGSGVLKYSGRWAVYATGAADYGADRVQPGDEVRLSGLMIQLTASPSEPAWQNRLASQGISAEVRVRRPGGVTVLSSSSGSWFARLAAKARNGSLKALRSSLSPSDASVVSAIFLGDKDKLDPDVQGAFQATGTVHLLATAGLHIGILVLIFQFIAVRLTVPRKWMAGAGIAMVWVYALMAGGRPAVTRAAFVASIYFAAIILERIPDLLSALSFCAIVLLWVNPNEVQDTGFQFTFLTVLGIAALMPALMDVWNQALANVANKKRIRVIKEFCEIESLSLAAQASSAPLVAIYFNLVTIYGLAANLLAVPLMFVLLPLTLVVILFTTLWAGLGAFAGHLLLTPVLHLVIGIIGGIASLPHCAVSVESPTWFQVGVYYAALFGGSFVVQVLTVQTRSSDHRGGSAAAAEPAGIVLEPAPAGRADSSGDGD